MDTATIEIVRMVLAAVAVWLAVSAAMRLAEQKRKWRGI